MNQRVNNPPNPVRHQAAFTLAEVALTLAVVAFAMIAIFGILPTAATVQRDNRAETIINYDARYWMEAIRSGQMPLSYNADGSVKEWQAVSHSALTNHVYWVRVVRLNATNTFTYTGQPDWPESVIGRLSFPDSFLAFTLPEPVVKKIAKVRSLTGRMGNAAADAGFHYFLETSITPSVPLSVPPTYMETNLYRLRLTFRWPIILDTAGNEVAGNGYKTFATLVSGTQFGGYRNTDLARPVGADWVVQKKSTLPAPMNEYSDRLHYFRPTMFEPYK